MPNMSYCRFENTFHDLRDCFNALNEEQKLSESEKKFAKKMLKEMADFLINGDIIEIDHDGQYQKENVDKYIDGIT